MTAALAGLAAGAGEESRPLTAAGLLVFGLGFGMVGQVLVTVVQNSRRPARARHRDRDDGLLPRARRRRRRSRARRGLRRPCRRDVIGGVQAVLLVAVPIAALALVAVLLLRERSLA